MRRHFSDIFVALALTISTIVTIVLVSYEVSDLGEKLRFDVYDSSHFTGAHWLLHKRLAGNLTTPYLQTHYLYDVLQSPVQ